MSARKNHIVVLFFILCIINVIIFFYRDRFTYHNYSTYASLYSSNTLRWKKFVDDYPKEELRQAKGIIDSLHISNQPTSIKVQEIGKFLYNAFNKQLGKSSTQLVSISPLAQYRILRSSDTLQLWCGNFAEMFTFFCWSQGIASRVIEIINPGDHHVLSESYLPEFRQWAVTDLTNNHLLIQKANNNDYPNLLSLRDSSAQALSSIQANDSTIVLRPFNTTFYDKYFGNKNPIYYYYRTNNAEVYRPIEKIKRYFLPDAWYEEITQGRPGNWAFYTKQFFILLWLISVVLLIGQLVSMKSKLKL
jgi:hypothetical protein